jgi:hypothetical protein
MKRLSILLFSLLSLGLKAQNLSFGYNPINVPPRQEIYITNSPTNNIGDRYVLAVAHDSLDFYFRSQKFGLRSLRSDMTSRSDIKTVALVQDSGWIYKGDIYGVLDTTLRIATRSWVQTGFLPIGTTTFSIPESGNLYYTNARARAAMSAGTGIGFSLSTGVISNTAPDQTVSITGAPGLVVSGNYPNFTIRVDTPVINGNVTRALSPAGSGGTFVISTTQYATVTYPLTLTVSTPLLAGSATATAVLQYQRPGQTWWNNAAPAGNAQSVLVTISAAISTPGIAFVSGKIPPNCSVRILTAVSGNTPGTVTYGATVGTTSVLGTEILSYF